MPNVPRPRTRKTVPETETPETPESKSSPPRAAAAKRPTVDDRLAGSIRGMYEGLGMLGIQAGMMSGNPAFLQFGHSLMGPEIRVDMRTGEPIASDDPRTGADKITDAWMTLADRNPRVKTALKRFTEGGAFAEVIILHATLVTPFLPGIPGLARFFPGQYPPAAENGAAVH